MTKEQTEKRNDLITRAEELLNTAKEEKRELKTEEVEEINQIKENVRAIDETAQLAEDIAKFEKKEVKEDKMEEEKRSIEAQEEAAFDAFIRGTVNERSGELTPASGSGQAVIPTTIANRIVKKVYDICPILARSTHYNVKGTLELPLYDETSSHDNITVAYASEFSALTSHSGAFSTVSLTGFLAGALTKISRSLINNAQFNIVNFVVDEMAEAIARFIEKELLYGTTNKISGLAGGVTLSQTAASASAITADEIVKVHDKIKDRFQNDAIWIMSSATRTALRLLKDNQGVYLLNDDISSPFGSRLLGKPVFVSDNMDDIATGKTVIFYGDMKGLVTKFDEQINIDVLREHYAPEHAVGVVGWFELDAKVWDAQRIAKLVMA